MAISVKRLQILLPAIYLLGALIVWIDFARLPPDGLANVGIALYTIPDFFIVRLVSTREFPFFGGSYYTAHAYYFWISVTINSILLYYTVRFLTRFFQRQSRSGSRP